MAETIILDDTLDLSTQIEAAAAGGDLILLKQGADMIAISKNEIEALVSFAKEKL